MESHSYSSVYTIDLHEHTQTGHRTLCLPIQFVVSNNVDLCAATCM